jgi:hypothetical protein
MALDQKTLAEHGAVAADLARNAPWSTFQFNPVGFD